VNLESRAIKITKKQENLKKSKNIKNKKYKIKKCEVARLGESRERAKYRA